MRKSPSVYFSLMILEPYWVTKASWMGYPSHIWMTNRSFKWVFCGTFDFMCFLPLDCSNLMLWWIHTFLCLALCVLQVPSIWFLCDNVGGVLSVRWMTLGVVTAWRWLPTWYSWNMENWSKLSHAPGISLPTPCPIPHHKLGLCVVCLFWYNLIP